MTTDEPKLRAGLQRNLQTSCTLFRKYLQSMPHFEAKAIITHRRAIAQILNAAAVNHLKIAVELWQNLSSLDKPPTAELSEKLTSAVSEGN